MLSSASNIVGTSAQGNYNAGNAVQDAIANMRSNKPCQFISLNIGWIEDAVATVNNNQRRKGLSRAGLRSIAPDELLRFLDHALVTATKKRGASQMIIGFDTNSLSEASNSSGNGNVHSAMFRHVYNPDKLSSSSLAPGTLSFKDLAAEGNHDSLIDFVAILIANKLTELISTDAVRILSEKRSILELGLDSLVAIELRNWIVREFEAPLQSSEVVLDQTIRMLADKVVDRSRTSSAGANKQVGSTTAQELPVWNSSGRNPGVLQFTPSSVPLPLLENTLHSFQESRRAVDSEADQKSLADAVSSFLDGTGQALQRQLEILEPGVIAENYESQIYLQRREPLQDYSLFAIIHPVEAPTHSQAMRAALLTVAAIQFADGQASGVPRSDSTRGVGVRSDAQNWLFYATRRPEVGVDRIVCSPPNRSVVVLRRGHVFQLALGDAGASLSLSAMETSYTAIIDSSNGLQMRVCTLTADERDSWALLRRNLELDPGNAAVLSAIDEAAFVVCLDDESPSTPGERLTQFLINGHHQPFANRWLDKPVQLAVTANGLSAGIHEHSKIDGLDVRPLHRHLIRTLMSFETNSSASVSENTAVATALKSYAIRKLTWNPGQDAIQRITHLESTFNLSSSPYGLMGHEHVKISGFGRAFLRGRGTSPNAAANLVAILALFLVDGNVRAAWEVVSLAEFAGGRIDWIQTVSTAVRAFVEAAAATTVGDGKVYVNEGSVRAHVRSLFREAARLHSKTVALAAQGDGYVNHLYALRGVSPGVADENEDLPALFRTSAWNATRRGGTGQDLKIGFEPAEDEIDENGIESVLYRWKEAGFLMAGDRGVYIHCDVSENHASFFVSARPGYTMKVCKAINTAATCISQLLAE